MRKEYPPLPNAGYLSRVTGQDKEVVDELVRDTQLRHPQATREAILDEAEWWGFDPTHQPSHQPSQTPSTKR